MAFRSSQYTNLQGSASGAATMPAGVAVGDVLVAVIEVDNSALGTVTPPTNWTQRDILQPALPDGMTCIIYDRIADGNESTQRTWTGLSATVNQGIIVGAWSGRNTSAPRTFLQSTSNTSANSSAVSVALAGGTAAANDDIAWFACGDSNGTTGWVWAAPASYTLRENQDQQWVPQALATRDAVSSGATGTITGTLTNAGNTAGFSGWVVGIAVTAGGPSITSNPSAQQVASGATASFSVTASASGGGTLGYQWKNGASNVGTNSSSYTTGTLGYSDDGSLISCVVTETGGSSPGSATSSSAVLTVGTLVVGANTPVYSASAGTTVAPSYSTLPAIVANDEIVLIVAQKPSAANGGTVTTPSGYTLQGSLTGAGGYGATLANNTGNTNLFVYSKTATGSETGALTVTVGTNGVCGAVFVLLRPIAGSTISYGFASGSDSTAGNVSITCGSDPGELAGDVALQIFNGSSQLILPFSAQALTTTGITYGVVLEVVEYGTVTGNDVAGYVAVAKAQSGTSSAAPVFTATVGGTNTNARGPGTLLRIRASSSALTWAPDIGYAQQPQRGPASPTPPLAAAPIGTGVFSLRKFDHDRSASLPPRALAPSRPALGAIAPIGALLVAGLSSLGWNAPADPSARIPAPNRAPTETSAPAGPLTPFVSTSTGWLNSDYRTPTLRPLRVEPSAPTGPLVPFVSPTLGWLNPESRSPFLPPPRAQEAAQPTAPLSPFVSPSFGWSSISSAAPLLARPRAQDAVQPLGSLATASTSLGWLVTENRPLPPTVQRDQEARQPAGPLVAFVSVSTGWFTADLVPDQPTIRRIVSESAPVGSLLTPQPFGWYGGFDQTRPAPTVYRQPETAAPVGTPFAIALPSNGWLATDNPRTPLKLGRSAPTDPVGNLLVLPPLPNLSWLLAADNPRTPYVTHRDPPNDPVGAPFPFLARLGPYWFIDQARSRFIAAATPYPSEAFPPLSAVLTSLGWQSVEAKAPSAQRSRPLDPQQPTGPLVPFVSPSIGWFGVEAPRQGARAQRPIPFDPVNSLTGSSLTSLGWSTFELPRPQSAPARAQQPQQALPALQFGSTPWASLDIAIRPTRGARPSVSEPVGTLIVTPPSTHIAWMQAVELPPQGLAPSRFARLLYALPIPPLVAVVPVTPFTWPTGNRNALPTRDLRGASELPRAYDLRPESGQLPAQDIRPEDGRLPLRKT